MRHVRLWIILLVSSVLSITCKQNDPTPAQPAITGTIQGQVTDATGEMAIEGAIVTTSPSTESVSTNSHGMYSISNVIPAEYTVTAAWGDYLPGSVSIHVSAGATTTTNVHLGYLELSTQGLVAYLPFDGNAEDGSGHGNDGIVLGATLIPDRFGNADAAFNFDGSTNYIDLGNNESLSPTNELSVGAWINLGSEANSQQDIVSKHGDYNANSQSYLLAWGYTPPKTVSFFVGDNGQYMYGRSSSSQLLSGTGWHFVVGVFRSKSNLDVYIDGQKVNGELNVYSSSTIMPTDTIPSEIARTSTPVRIGIWKTSADNWFSGGIDDVRIYNRALDTVEILALYHENGWSGN